MITIVLEAEGPARWVGRAIETTQDNPWGGYVRYQGNVLRRRASTPERASALVVDKLRELGISLASLIEIRQEL